MFRTFLALPLVLFAHTHRWDFVKGPNHQDCAPPAEEDTTEDEDSQFVETILRPVYGFGHGAGHEPSVLMKIVDTFFSVYCLQFGTEVLAMALFIRLCTKRRDLRRLGLTVSRYIFEPPGEAGSDLYAMAARSSAPFAQRFIKRSLWLVVVMNVFAVIICTRFLAASWTACVGFARPLRLWLIVFAVLHALQFPVHVAFLWSIRMGEASSRDMETCVGSFTNAPAWLATRVVKIFQCCWLLVGGIWLRQTQDYPSCSTLRPVIFLAVNVSMLRAGFLYGAHQRFASWRFRGTEARRRRVAEHGAGAAELALAPLSCEQIDTLPLVCIHLKGTRTGGSRAEGFCSNCTICLEDFHDGEFARRLPCRHDFHRGCIDTWLRRSNRCPLCAARVDAAI